MGGICDDYLEGPNLVKTKEVKRPSTVKVTSQNGYDHIVSGIKTGDSIYLKLGSSDSTIVRVDFNPVTGGISLCLPADSKFTIHTGQVIEELLTK